MVWAYGEDMVYYGMAVNQVASLCVQDKGRRLVFMLPFSNVVAHMQNTGALTPQLHVELQCLAAMQPQDVAQYSRNFPNSLVHALAPPSAILYLLAGWILCEKVVNYQCVFGIRASVVCVDKKCY